MHVERDNSETIDKTVNICIFLEWKHELFDIYAYLLRCVREEETNIERDGKGGERDGDVLKCIIYEQWTQHCSFLIFDQVN